MERFTVACCQVRAYDLEDAEENLAGLLRALDEAGALGADLVALPECAWPAYHLRDADPYARPGVRPYAEVADLFAEKARRHGYWLAAGMAVPHAGGALTNSGVVFTPGGEVAGCYDKSFLWHFDNDWFRRGDAFPVFDAGFARFGVLICADGRQPEIARSLAVNGAEVILDLTAWVSWAGTVEQLTTTQCEYLMPVRAFENGAWVAAADKWGAEDGSLVYAGRSRVIDPHGETRVAAPSTGDAVVAWEIDPSESFAPPPPRRPTLYGRLTQPWEDAPARALLEEPLVPARENRRVAVVPGDADGAFDPAAVVARHEALRAQDCDLTVFAGMTAPEGWQASLPVVERAVRARGGAVALAVASSGCTAERSAALVTPDGTIEHRATHGRGIDLGETNAPVAPTPAGNVAILCGDEGYAPEVARCLALEGADLLAWPCFADHPMNERVLRARADENRVYVAAAWPDGGAVASPAGALLTVAPRGAGVAMGAQVNRAAARWKDMAPGTHALRDRVPHAYGALTDEGAGVSFRAAAAPRP